MRFSPVPALKCPLSSWSTFLGSVFFSLEGPSTARISLLSNLLSHLPHQIVWGPTPVYLPQVNCSWELLPL